MDDRAKHAVTVLRQILRATESYDRRVTRATGLTSSQLLLMQVLSDRGALSAGALAAQLGVAQATMTSLLHRLEDKGLIERRRGETDRRQVWLSLTGAGQATLDRAPEGLQVKFGTRFSSLAEWEQSMLVAALERVVTMLDAEDVDASAILTVGELSGVPDR